MADYKSQKTQLHVCDKDYDFKKAIKTLETLSCSRYDKEYERFMKKYEEKSRKSSDVVDFRDMTLVEDHGTLKRKKHKQPFGSMFDNIEKTDKEKQLLKFAIKTVKSNLSLRKDIGNKIQQENAHPSFYTASLGSSLHGNETQQNLNNCTILSTVVDTEAKNSKLKNKKKIRKGVGSTSNSVCLKSNASLCWKRSRTAPANDSKLSSSFYKKLSNLNITEIFKNNQKNDHKNVQGKQVFSRYFLRSTVRKQCFNTSENVSKLCRKNNNCIIKKKGLPNVRKYNMISCRKKHFEGNSLSIADHDKNQSLVLEDIDKSEQKNLGVDNLARGNSFCPNSSFVSNPTSYNRYIKEKYPDLILLDMDFDDSMNYNFEAKIRNEDEAKSTLSQSKKNCYMLQQEANESESDMRNAHIKVLTIDDLPINTIESENTPLHRSHDSSLSVKDELQISSDKSMLKNSKFLCSDVPQLSLSNSLHGLQSKSLFTFLKKTCGTNTHCDMYPSSNHAICLKTLPEKKQSAYSCTFHSKENQNYISPYTKIHYFYEHNTDLVDSSSSTRLSSTSGRTDLSNSRNSQSECHTGTKFLDRKMKVESPINHNGGKSSMNPAEKIAELNCKGPRCENSKLFSTRWQELQNCTTMLSLNPYFQHNKVSPNSNKVNKTGAKMYCSK